jgi:hypothetical protein
MKKRPVYVDRVFYLLERPEPLSPSEQDLIDQAQKLSGKCGHLQEVTVNAWITLMKPSVHMPAYCTWIKQSGPSTRPKYVLQLTDIVKAVERALNIVEVAVERLENG